MALESKGKLVMLGAKKMVCINWAQSWVIYNNVKNSIFLGICVQYIFYEHTQPTPLQADPA